MNDLSVYISKSGHTNDMRATDRRAGKAVGCGGARPSDQYSVAELIAGWTRGGRWRCNSGFFNQVLQTNHSLLQVLPPVSCL